MILNNRIKKLRENIKLTQKELATLVDKDESLISMHENMKRPLTQNDILCYAKIFKVQTHELFMDAEDQ